jgi:hypothetical protein
MTLRNLTKLSIAFVFFTFLSGFRGCYVSGQATGPVYAPPGGTVVVETVTTVPVLTGDIELTVFAPAASAVTPDTVTFNVTVREGGAFGPVVLKGYDYVFDSFGVGVIDIGDLGYGFYDIEVIGMDILGNSVSHAAQGITVDEPLSILTLDLDPVLLSGDVALDLVEPDSGLFSGPIDSIDYVLWEIDPTTGELVFVEQFIDLAYNPWNEPVIGNLNLGTYHLEVVAYDVFGVGIYEFAGSFNHDNHTTFLPVNLWYL